MYVWTDGMGVHSCGVGGEGRAEGQPWGARDMDRQGSINWPWAGHWSACELPGVVCFLEAAGGGVASMASPGPKGDTEGEGRGIRNQHRQSRLV